MLTDKVVLVSGGTSGLGARVAAAAVRNGATTVVTGRRAEQGAKTAADLGATYRQCDVGDPAQVIATVESVVAEFGRVDGLVNSAALTDRGTLLETNPEAFDAHMAVDLRGPFFAMQAVVRDLLRRGAPGSIVNIGSEQGYGGSPDLAAYATAKGGLATLTRNVAHTHRFDRIRVNCLNIGWTDTDGEDLVQRRFHGAGDDWRERAAERLPAGRLGDPDEIADMIVFLLSDRSGVVTGSVLDWDQAVLGTHD